MTIVVEDGTKPSGANSYISEANCKIYLDLRGLTEWGLESTENKQASLIRATDYLESNFKNRWQGFKTSSDQSLSFPRYDVYDEDGYYFSETEIPQELIDAQCLLANKAILDGELVLLTQDVTQDNLINSKKRKVSDIETETVYFESLSGTYYKNVISLLRPLFKPQQSELIRG